MRGYTNVFDFGLGCRFFPSPPKSDHRLHSRHRPYQEDSGVVSQKYCYVENMYFVFGIFDILCSNLHDNRDNWPGIVELEEKLHPGNTQLTKRISIIMHFLNPFILFIIWEQWRRYGNENNNSNILCTFKRTSRPYCVVPKYVYDKISKAVFRETAILPPRICSRITKIPKSTEKKFICVVAFLFFQMTDDLQ